MASVWKKIFDVIDDILAYVLTVVGILISRLASKLNSDEPIDLVVETGHLVVSAFIAVIIIGKQESLSVDEAGSKDKSRDGRRKRFWQRMSNALSQGMMWNQLIGLAA